jgi:hypothetical protein
MDDLYCPACGLVLTARPFRRITLSNCPRCRVRRAGRVGLIPLNDASQAPDPPHGLADPAGHAVAQSAPGPRPIKVMRFPRWG